MLPLIDAIDKNILKAELSKEKFVRNTNFGSNEIYIITAHDSPNVMKEIGRLRELSFRESGGGTGKEIDIDVFDTMPNPYKQLIVWNPTDWEIIGGYRYICLKDTTIDAAGNYQLATTHMFEFSQLFIDKYLPQTIELGRSFVQPKYQPSKDSRKGIFSLDNLWDGLGALIVDFPDIKYFFGKVTLYLSFDKISRDTILYFLMKFFPDNEGLIQPHSPMKITKNIEELDAIFNEAKFEDNYKKLLKQVRMRNEQVPPLINAYMNLSPTMKTFGAVLNPEFGEVEEIGILINIEDIYLTKKNRHISSYLNEKK